MIPLRTVQEGPTSQTSLYIISLEAEDLKADFKPRGLSRAVVNLSLGDMLREIGNF